MLGLLRRNAKSLFLKITLIIIILVFIFLGVGGNDNSSRNVLATVNGDSISYQDYQKEYDRTLTNFRDQFGGNVPKGLLESLNIKDQVVNKLIQTALLRQGAKESGLYVSNRELRTTIQEMAAFQNNGVFDNEWYKEVLTSSRLSVSNFEAGMRYDLLSAKGMDHLSRFGKVSENELQDYFNYNYGTRKLDYINFTADSFKDKVEVTEDAIAGFFEENKENYQTDLMVKLNYLFFGFDESGGDLPSEQAISQYYQNNITTYSIAEKRKARHILLRTSQTDSPAKLEEKQKQMEDILAKANNGEDFAELAKAHSEDGSAQQGGDLGSFSRGQMVKPFEDAVFSLQEGEISQVVQTQFGLHLIKLDTIENAYIKPLESVKQSISASLKRESAKTDSFKKANNAYEQIILAGSLANYAKSSQEKEESKVAIMKTDFFSQTNPPESLRTLPQLVNTAFSLNATELSSIIDTSNGYAIVYIEDSKPPAPQQLSDVREKAEQDFIAQESVALALAAAESLLTKLKEGGDIAIESSNVGTEVATTPSFSKAEPATAGLPNSILDQSWKLSKKKPLLVEVAASGNNYYVVMLNESTPPNEELFKEKKDELANQMKTAKGNSLLAAWVEHLQKGAKITINKELL